MASSDEQIKFLPTAKTRSQDLIYKTGAWELPPNYDFNLHDTGETNDSEKLSLLVKMSFGYGGIGQYLYALVFGFFMSPFLLEVAGLPAISAGVIQSIVAVYGALINPVVGFLSDLSPHPRRVSWIAFSTIPFSYAYFLFWLVPPFESQGWKIAYYFAIYTLLSTLFACFVVPYNSLSAEITLSYDERTKLSGYRWVLSLSIGTLAIIAQAVLLFAFPEGDGEFNLEKGYALAGLVVAVILITPGIVVLLFVKERDLLSQKKVKTGIFQGIKITMSNLPFLFVVAINSCSWAALTFLTNNLFLYVDYVLQETIYFPIVIALILGICTISLPIWAWLTARYGKKLVYFAGTLIIIIALFPTTFLTADHVNVMFFLSAIGGCGLGVLYLIPYSMVPDVVEMDELRTGERREGSFFSIFIFFERLATGVSMLISGIVLQNTNYNAELEEQPQSVITGLQIMVGTIPPIILMISWIACYYYPITKRVHAQILSNLGEKQIISVNHNNAQSTASSGSSDA